MLRCGLLSWRNINDFHSIQKIISAMMDLLFLQALNSFILNVPATSLLFFFTSSFFLFWGWSVNSGLHVYAKHMLSDWATSSSSQLSVYKHSVVYCTILPASSSTVLNVSLSTHVTIQAFGKGKFWKCFELRNSLGIWCPHLLRTYSTFVRP